ncbi:Flp family type IVb pilin [Allopontixanthobacter sp.]|uniref:Flp family type IVb pilin n=1 Tax=Allopontixanthobacter sp. TaxID=2906452 RepID=UPI002AB80377|nr:Flp family type IVb pilin [Allopontixanthobacter sp.]MDZ4308705.1 Flp family type IVb pilin [Allopontixanthobacter sp.]
MKPSTFLNRLGCDASGATAVEYGLILALIFLAIIGAVQGFGVAVTDMWNDVSTAIIVASQ